MIETARPSRRSALEKGAATSAWLAAGGSSKKEPATPGLRRAIPASGEEIAVIGLGTYQAFDVGTGASDRAALKAVLQALVDGGGSVVDSSPMYGRAEGVVGALASELALRPSLFLATKVWTSGREAGVQQMEQSFRSLRSSTIDLMQIHNLVDWKTQTAALKQWKERGQVRYIGITHYHQGAYGELERLIKTREYDFVQLNYSISEREAEQSVLPMAQAMGVAVIANRPFAKSGLFSRVRGKPLPPWASEVDCDSWARFFLKYIASNPAVTCIIPATSNPKHMQDNMLAGVGRMPDAETRRRMAKYFDDL